MSKPKVSASNTRAAERGTTGRVKKCRTLTLLLFAPAGCAAPPPATIAAGPPAPAPTTATAIGDWDDIDAAVRTALRTCQLASESRKAWRTEPRGEETLIEYHLLTVRGDTGLLRVRNLRDGSIMLECRIGILGSAEAQRCVIDHVTERLEALHNTDYAPLAP